MRHLRHGLHLALDMSFGPPQPDTATPRTTSPSSPVAVAPDPAETSAVLDARRVALLLAETERDIEALRLLTPQKSGDPLGQERIQKLHRIVVNEFECVLETLEQVPKKDAAVVALRDAVKRYGAG